MLHGDPFAHDKLSGSLNQSNKNKYGNYGRKHSRNLIVISRCLGCWFVSRACPYCVCLLELSYLLYSTNAVVRYLKRDYVIKSTSER